MIINFKPMQTNDIALWQTWISQPHVNDVWFLNGYETADYIFQKVAGNGHDYPFIIYLGEKPIGYIQCCDLDAYRTHSPHPTCLFTHEQPGAFGMDLFIGEGLYLNQGYGTLSIKTFIHKIFTEFKANIILVDPAVTNKRAIKSYEKAGFRFVKQENDGVTQCCVMKIEHAEFAAANHIALPEPNQYQVSL